MIPIPDILAAESTAESQREGNTADKLKAFREVEEQPKPAPVNPNAGVVQAFPHGRWSKPL